MGDIDSCYREVIMVVCQVNQELDLQNAQFVQKTLGRLKTRMADLVARLSYRSIAQRLAGLSVQQALSSVVFVAKKSRLTKARISNIVIWSAEIKATNTKQVSKQGLGKVIKRLTRLYINGLHHTIRSLMFVNTAKRKDIQSGLTYLKIITESVMTGLISANRAILYTIANSIRTLDATNKYVDVIRKRYAKFIEPETWEDRWQKLTPAV